jgi:hypothetical protein
VSSRRPAASGVVLLIALPWSLLASAAGGETGSPPPEAEGADEPGFRGPPQAPRLRFDLYQRVKLRADLDKGDASVAVYRTGGSAGISKFFGYIRLGLRLSAERSVYDFSRGERINSPPDPPTPSDPWTDLALVRLNLSLLIPIGRSEWSVFAFGGLRFGGERGTEVSDGLSGSFGLSVGYRVCDTLTLQVGFALVTRIEGSPFGFPLVGVRWKPTEWFRLETRGPGVEAGLKPIEELEITAGARYANRQYRLEDKRRFLAEHVVEDQEVLVELGLTWKPLETFRVHGTVGLVAYQEFEVRDGRGDTRYRSRTNPAPQLELLLALEF